MNEQIQRLVDQAKASVPAGLQPSEWLEQYHVKFAELIVRECGNYMNSRIPGNLELSATVAKMKQHFGVEE